MEGRTQGLETKWFDVGFRSDPNTPQDCSRYPKSRFEIVDIIAWCYGTGFPKSHNISKAIDKAAGAERIVVGYREWNDPMNKPYTNAHFGGDRCRDDKPMPITAPSTDAAREWDGWGTALKPAWEPIIVARKKNAEFSLPDYTPFHYIPKPSKSERSEGLESVKNNHPTVKPIALMEALVKEFTEEDSTVFDPFTGSGTTGIASVKEGRNFIGCELTPEYIPLARARIEYHLPKEEE